eukprot:gb/GECG01004323.1/.p1 GENE.gb/GECG01004323.1/~~gb/GECG01004323.1/.p1  ORF type:complete len:1199 (+),score=106.52 gb/GECG01004323.1/:1-3597(+)
MNWIIFLFVLITVLLGNCGHAEEPPQSVHYHEYVVIGAGPAGLQYSWFLKTAGRDYVTLEKSESAGGSFNFLPRWRRLISVNKVHLDRDNLDFNLRHDWNSLLSDPSHMMTRIMKTNPKFLARVFPDALQGNSSMEIKVSAGGQNYSLRELVQLCCTEAGTRVWSEDESVVNNETFAGVCQSLPHWMLGCLSSSDSRLSVDDAIPGILMRHFTHEYFPHADHLVDYLNSFASITQPNIVYNTTVVGITKPEDIPASLSAHSENVRYRVVTAAGEEYFCKKLVLALGLTKPTKPELFKGHELLHSYATAPTNLDAYKGKKVLIIGRGNGAMEFADNVMNVAAYVHLLGGIHRRLRLAWESHYPGDLRAIHNKVLESYQLKTLDALIEAPLEPVSFETIAKEDVEEYKRRQQYTYPFSPFTDSLVKVATSDSIRSALHDTVSTLRNGLESIPRRNLKVHDRLSAATHSTGTVYYPGDGLHGQMHIDNYTDHINQSVLPSSLRSRPLKRDDGDGEILGRNLFDEPSVEDGLFYRHPRSAYDIVIACLGWKFDTSLFNESALPALDKMEKFPIITPRYESVNNEGMYFVGTASHSIDVRVAAGGFIHGFRYTARALHRIDEEMRSIDVGELQTIWPFHVIQPKRILHGATQPSLLDRLVTRIQNRLNHASGLYQMFNGHLQDVILFEPVEHAELDPEGYFFRTPEDDNVMLPWFHSGDPVEQLTRAWADGELSKSLDYFSGIRAFYFEDVPCHAVPYLVRRWAYRLFGNALFRRGVCTEAPDLASEIDCVLRQYNGVRYSTIYLEYSSEWSIANGSRDPFKPERVLGSNDRPEDSGFLHPRMRTYDTMKEDGEGFTTTILEQLQRNGVRPPKKPESPSYTEATGDAARDTEGMYASMDVRDRNHVISEAIFEDFSAEFYTYWKATRPLQRYFIETLRRHCLIYFLDKMSYLSGNVESDIPDNLINGAAQVFFAHDIGSQVFLLDNPGSPHAVARSNRTHMIAEAVGNVHWPCKGDIAFILRSQVFGMASGFSRRRSRRDLTKLSNSLRGVTAVVSGEGDMTEEIYYLALQMSAKLPEIPMFLLGCNAFLLEGPPFRVPVVEHPSNATAIEVWLNRQKVLTLDLGELEIDTPSFECSDGDPTSTVLSCSNQCNPDVFSNIVDSRIARVGDDPSNATVIEQIVLPSMRYLIRYCLSEDSYADIY